MSICFRKADIKDCDLLYSWANNPVVRANSFSQDPINYQDHVAWLQNKLQSPNTIIYIFCDENEPIAQVRIDIDCDVAYIDYSVDQEHRGKGIGTQILGMLPIATARDSIQASKLIGRVKLDNAPSIRAFRAAGYKENECNDYIEFFRVIE